jgi:hypothetical protein
MQSVRLPRKDILADLDPADFIDQSRIKTHFAVLPCRFGCHKLGCRCDDPGQLPLCHPLGGNGKTARAFDFDKDQHRLFAQDQIHFTGLPAPTLRRNLVAALLIMICDLIFGA